MLLLTRAAHKHKLTQLHLLLFEDARKHRNECSPWMRMPKSRQTGVCVRHGAGWRKYANICSANECTNLANEYAIMISMEQRSSTKKCSCEGCPNFVVRGGECMKMKHGAILTQSRMIKSSSEGESVLQTWSKDQTMYHWSSWKRRSVLQTWGKERNVQQRRLHESCRLRRSDVHQA